MTMRTTGGVRGGAPRPAPIALALLLALLFAGSPDRALARNPEITPLIVKGKNAIRDERSDRAFWYFYVAGSIDREDPEPWYYLGLALYDLGDYRNAMNAFDWALKYGLTENLRKSCRDLRTRAYQRRLDTKPHPVMAAFAKAQPNLWTAYRLMETGEFEKAARILEPAYQKLPRDFEIAATTALCMLMLNRVDDAYLPVRYAYRVARRTFGDLLEDYRLPKAAIYGKIEKLLAREKEIENFFKD